MNRDVFGALHVRRGNACPEGKSHLISERITIIAIIFITKSVWQ